MTDENEIDEAPEPKSKPSVQDADRIFWRGKTLPDGKHGKGFYYVRLQRGTKQIWRSTKLRNYQKAQTFLRRLQDDIDASAVGEPLPYGILKKRIEPPEAPKVPTVEEFSGRYLEWAKTEKASWKRDEGALRLYLIDFFGGTRLDELTPGQAEQYIVKRRGDEKKASDRSITIETKILQRMCSLAVKFGIIGSSPLVGLTHLKKTGKRSEYLRPSDIRAILAKAPAWLKWFIRLALCTGCRRGELMGLTWQDIDLDEDVLTIRAETSKSGRFRRIAIGPVLHRELQQRKGKQPLNPGGPVVTLDDDGIRAPYKDSPYLCLKRIVRSIGRPALRLHDTRAWTISTLNALGVQKLEVMEIVGHIDESVTNLYSHLEPTSPRAKDIAARLDAEVAKLFDEMPAEVDAEDLIARFEAFLDALPARDRAELTRRLTSNPEEKRS